LKIFFIYYEALNSNEFDAKKRTLKYTLYFYTLTAFLQLFPQKSLFPSKQVSHVSMQNSSHYGCCWSVDNVSFL